MDLLSRGYLVGEIFCYIAKDAEKLERRLKWPAGKGVYSSTVYSALNLTFAKMIVSDEPLCSIIPIVQ